MRVTAENQRAVFDSLNGWGRARRDGHVAHFPDDFIGLNLLHFALEFDLIVITQKVETKAPLAVPQ